nr:uncharacterized protein LOC129050506 isoform X4 [Pongo abelii]
MSCLSGNEGTPVAPEIGGGCLHWPLRKHSVCRNEGSRSGREKSTAIPLLSGAVRPSAVSMANPCPVNCSSWGCPKWSVSLSCGAEEEGLKKYWRCQGRLPRGREDKEGEERD